MSKLKVATLSNQAGTVETAIENVIHGSAKAWVNFNGTGTVAIRASYNVSSITDNGVGQYTVNFTNALADAQYATTVNASNVVSRAGDDTAARTTTAFKVTIQQSSFAVVDDANISVSVFR